jgi:predicted  nucleic acid-binding Zn-ribbon protein
MNWEDKTNNEIINAQIEMNDNYEATKNEIATLSTRIEKLMKELDKMDNQYLESKKVLNTRLSYK